MNSFSHHLKRVFFVWIALIAGASVLLSSLPHKRFLGMSFTQQCCMMLAGLLFLELAVKEKSAPERAIALNFFVFAGIAQTIETITFFDLTTLFSPDNYTNHYAYQYITCCLVPITELSAVTSSALTVFAPKGLHLLGYMVCMAATVTLGLIIYLPYIENAKYLYTVSDITDFRIIDRGMDVVGKQQSEGARDSLVAGVVALSKWEGNRRIGMLTRTEQLKRIAEIKPYLKGENYLLLLFRPIHLNVFLVNTMSFIILLSALMGRLVKDPPQAPYIDRILMIFLLHIAFQSSHFFIYAITTDMEKYQNNFDVSALLCFLSTALLLPFILLRLRFILSVEGRFFQSRVETNPASISRWRDEIDNIVLKQFFGAKKLIRRIFVRR